MFFLIIFLLNLLMFNSSSMFFMSIFFFFIYFFFFFLSMSFLGKIVLSLKVFGMYWTLILDFYSIFFFLLSCLVMTSIYYFSVWYMDSEPKKKFFMYLLKVFLFFMMLLVSTDNFIFLLVGWESVSVMSFFLIIWWNSRTEANSSSLQAIMYNRLGDFFMYLSIFYLMYYGIKMGFLFYSSNLDFFIFFFFFISMMAKSSQFFFHPWLPNAMESPTPVSSLLHSSTMVVAGVFLLLRLNMNMNNYLSEAVTIVSSLTMLISAMWSINQLDMKKVVAFSTTSQLSMMMVSLSMSYTLVTFVHLSLHAFFKSMIFMASSVFIHSNNNNQDIRNHKISLMSNRFTLISMFLCSLSISSCIFFSSYFSKDSILESSYGSFLNRLSIFILFFSSVLTVSYSMRLIFKSYNSNMKNLGFSLNMENMQVFLFLFVPIFISSLLSSSLIFFMFNFLEEGYLTSFLKLMPLNVFFFSIFLGLVMVKISFTFKNYYFFFFNPLIHKFYLYYSFYITNFFVFLEFKWWDTLMKTISSTLVDIFFLKLKQNNLFMYMFFFFLFFLIFFVSFL